MDDRERDFRRLPSFVLGGLLGASAVLATARRRRRIAARRQAPAGLAAFEQAPCYREAVEREPVSPSRDS
ncbi:MAG: hypothetical protein ACJ79R_14270 [Anaeromyxobacteraceae bacterium]